MLRSKVALRGFSYAVLFFLAFKGKQRDPKAGLAEFKHHWLLSGQVGQNDWNQLF